MITKKLALTLLSLVLFAAILSGCFGNSADEQNVNPSNQQTANNQSPAGVQSEAGQPEAAAIPDGFKQSPYLEGRGLPPVEDRLPKSPKLSNELPEGYINTEIGIYGGTLRTVRMNPTSDAALWIIQNEPIVNTPGLIGEEVTPIWLNRMRSAMTRSNSPSPCAKA